MKTPRRLFAALLLFGSAQLVGSAVPADEALLDAAHASQDATLITLVDIDLDAGSRGGLGRIEAILVARLLEPDVQSPATEPKGKTLFPLRTGFTAPLTPGGLRGSGLQYPKRRRTTSVALAVPIKKLATPLPELNP